MKVPEPVRLPECPVHPFPVKSLLMERKCFLWVKWKLKRKFQVIKTPTKGWMFFRNTFIELSFGNAGSGGGLPASCPGQPAPATTWHSPPLPLPLSFLPESWGFRSAWYVTCVICMTTENIPHTVFNIASVSLHGFKTMGAFRFFANSVFSGHHHPSLRLRFQLPWPFATVAFSNYTSIWFSSLEKKHSIFASPNRVEPT